MTTERDEHITKVIFRRDKDENIIAFFPEEGFSYDTPHLMMAYQHVGQHGPASILYYYKNTKPATKWQYHDLYEELTRIGYNLKVCTRINDTMRKNRHKSTHNDHTIRIK